MARYPKIDAAMLKSLLHYNPETGVFTWIVERPGGQIKPGMVAGTWCTTPGHTYVLIGVCMRTYTAHRLAWLYMTGQWPTKQLDHKNGDHYDNRWSNLREATASQNQGNMKRPITNSSGFKGVSLAKGGKKWRATIVYGGKVRHLGTFSSPEKAAAAYWEAAVRVHGEFARPA